MTWKEVEGFPDYLVSDTGIVKDAVTGIIKKTHPDWEGYRLVHLRKNGRQSTQKVHRLVALAFIPNPEGKPTVNHINEIKDDNRVENLEWATYREQIFHGTRNDRAMKSIESKPVFQCNDAEEVLRRFESVRDAAREMNVKPEQIINAIKGHSQKSAGFRWRYEDADKVLTTGTIKNRPVVKVADDGAVVATYSSLQEAAHAIGRSPSNLCLCLQGKRRSCAGFRWRYSVETSNDNYLQNKIDSKKIPVLQFNRQGDFLCRFDSVSKAAKTVGVNTGDICRVLKGRRKTSGGYQWKYA